MIQTDCTLAMKAIGLMLSFLLSAALGWTQGGGPVYDSTGHDPSFSFRYPEPGRQAELAPLRQRYRLDTLLDGRGTDLQKLLSVLDWVHRQWKHSGDNEPSKPDALTILKEAADGKRFRCVEYATVLSSALNALGFKARVVGLKTADAETRKGGAGHVLTEVWLLEFDKWALADAQYNVMPVLRGVPLNAVELRRALSGDNDLKFVDKNSEVDATRKMIYRFFIQSYLYYLEAPIIPKTVTDSNGKKRMLTHVMLVPAGAKNPTVFQQVYPIDYAVYTHSLKGFYRKPE